MSGARVDITAAFLARAYQGPDPDGFARWLGRAAAAPDWFVYASPPATLGVLELRQAGYEFGRVCWGHHLCGDWRVLRMGLAMARAHGADAFFYPIMAGQANGPRLATILTERYGFRPYHTVYMKGLTDGHFTRPT